MLANLISHMPQLFFNTIIDKHYCYVSKHFMLALVSVIISYLVFIREDDLRVFYQR